MIFNVDNIKIYNVDEAKRYAGYPKLADISDKTLNKLAHADSGSGHDCWLKGIMISFELTAPLYFWKQFQRYHFHDIVSSESTMHCIEKMSIRERCNQYVDSNIIELVEKIKTEWLMTKSKEAWYKLIASLPCGFMLTAGIVSNVLQEKSIINQRKNHKLLEWEIYCQMIDNAIYKETGIRLLED